MKATAKIISLTHYLYTKFHLVDQTVMEGFGLLMKEAEEKGYYLSPKEVPFDIKAFSQFLEKKVEVKRSYWATISLVGWIQESNLLKNRFLRKSINMTLIPFLAFTDRLVAKETKYLEATIVAPIYAFHVWEGVFR